MNDGLFEQIKNSLFSESQWRDAIEGQGLELPPKGKQGPCPCCGGTDRFSFDNKFNQGNSFCRQCDNQSRDGIALVADYHGITQLEAAKRIGASLGIEANYQSNVMKVDFAALVRNDRRKKAAAKAEAEEAKKLKSGAAKAQSIINNYCQPARENQEYLVKKKVKTYGTYELIAPVQGFPVGSLVVPIYNENEVISLELIDDDKKRPLFDTKKTGGFFPIGSLEGQKRILIAESFGTGASLKEVFGCGVVAAFSAGNLKAAAETIQRLYPDAEVLIAADNDSHKKSTGEKAAKKTGFPWSMPTQAGDWSNVYLSGGDVKAEFEANIRGKVYEAGEAREKVYKAIREILTRFIGNHPTLDENGVTDFMNALIAATAGTGKSTTTLKVISELLDFINFAEYYLPTVDLAEELDAKAQELGISTAIIRGRDKKTPTGEPMCQRNKEAAELSGKGIPVYSSLCAYDDIRTGKPYRCPHFYECQYIKQFNTDAKLRIYASARLGLSRGLEAFKLDKNGDHITPDFAIIDEQIHPEVIRTKSEIDANRIMSGPIPDQAKSILLQWLTTNERPEWSEALVLADIELSKTFQKPCIRPDATREQVSAALAAYNPERALRRLVRAIRDNDQTMAERVTKDNGKSHVFSLAYKEKIERFNYSKGDQKHRIPVLNIDASGREKVLKAVTGWNWKTVEINAERTNVKFIQYVAFNGKKKTFSRNSFGIKPTTNPRLEANRAANRAEAIKVIGDRAAEHKKLLLITYKDLVPMLGGLPPNVAVMTFGNLRGIDAHKDADGIFILGRHEPNAAGIRAEARAIFGDAMLTNKEYEELLTVMFRDDETEQGVDRGRLVGNLTPKTVYLAMDKLPESITPDQTITWSEAKCTRVGAQTVIDQLVERFGGVPMSAAFLHQHAPEIVGNLEQAKKVVQRKIKPELINIQSGQSPIDILIGNCPDQGINKKPVKMVILDNQPPDSINSKLSQFGYEVVPEATQPELPQPKPIEADTAEPEIRQALVTHRTACGAMTDAVMDYQTGRDVVTLDALRDDKSIELLPDDYRWLKGLMVSRMDKPELLDRYKSIWIEAANDPRLLKHQRHNAGRFKANQWILHKVGQLDQLTYD